MRCTEATLRAFGICGEAPLSGVGVVSALREAGYRVKPLDFDEWQVGMQGMRLDEFIQSHPKGMYYLSTPGHAMALVNGVLTDTSGQTGRRRLVLVMEVTGSIHKTAARKRAPKLGDCFEAAGKYVMDHGPLMGGPDQGLLLVHGEVIGQGPIEGVHFGHAWVEDGDMVIDTSNGRNVRMPKAAYYAIGGIDRVNNVYRYTFKQMQDKILSSGHWGPWDMKTSSGL